MFSKVVCIASLALVVAGYGYHGGNNQGIGYYGGNNQGIGHNGGNNQVVGHNGGNNNQGIGHTGGNNQGVGHTGANNQGGGHNGGNNQGIGYYGGNNQGLGHNGGNNQATGQAVSSQHISRHDGPAQVVHIKGDGHHHGDTIDYYTYPLYQFGYKVSDPHTGDHKTQYEHRDGDVVKGYYSFHEPDGSVRHVKYHGDKKSGFHADVHHSTRHIIPEKAQH